MESSPSPPPYRLAFASSFFLLGLLNNVLYVVILSAALDLVDKASTPKGVILAVNIAPALLVKVGWPYLVKVSQGGSRGAWSRGANRSCRERCATPGG